MVQEGVDDMTLLSKITNEQISANLEQRYYKNIIYTYIGDVLISVNPFQQLQIYADDILWAYVGKPRIELPPHIYAIAEESYRSMTAENFNQCIIISGESGAGKTEAAKKVMHYIATITGGSNPKIDKVKHVIVESNPLLEAFGNAKTLRNNNSSRFGKYFEIQFDRDGNPDGGLITNYLLEKSRVVYQQAGERNFHIFYQLTKGATQQERQQFKLMGPEKYLYTSMGQSLNVQGIDDVADFKEVRQAMNVMGITAGEQAGILGLLAGILWLGNIDFNEKADAVSVKNMDALDQAAALLKVPSSFVKNVLEERTVETKHGAKRGTTYKVPLNKIQAIAGRDALAKGIYDRIFDWLVARINAAMHKQETGLTIGVLDIYGFEIFNKNGFEQFCINYVNEKLQQIFIEFVLKQEQEEYIREGIKWQPIDYFNNKIVCDLFEGKNPPGLMAILDDVCRSVHGVAEGADQALSQRLTGCSGNKHFDMRGKAFLVRHYAGDVTYEVTGMVEKNKDVFLKDHLELVKSTDNQFLSSLFPEDVDEDNRKPPSTAGFKIKTSCGELVAKLSAAQPHYVRTIKPNDNKEPNNYDKQRVLHQVQYLGLLDNLKVKRAGFAYRTTFPKFMERYYLISGSTSYAAQKIWKGNDIDGCKAILKDQPISPEEWQIGKTKVFIRHPETLFYLEDLRVNYWHNMTDRIKYAYRIWKSYKHVAANRIKTAWRSFKTYRVACAVTIQRAYRSFMNVAPTADLRVSNERFIQGKKERRRLSVTSIRRFFGDYLDIKSKRPYVDVMGPGANEEVIFSFKCNIVVHPGLIGKKKLSPRILILTHQALYLIMIINQKGQIINKLDRRIELQNISGAMLSPFADNFIILVNQLEMWDVALELEFKTELLAWLTYKNGSVGSNIIYMDKLKYNKKKKSKENMKFLKDDATLGTADGLYKNNKIKIATGLPPNTPIVEFRRKQGQELQRPVIKPDDPIVIQKKSGFSTVARGRAPPRLESGGGAANNSSPAPKKAMGGGAGPKKMGGGPGPSAGGPKKMGGGPGPSAGGPKKMGGGPAPVGAGPKKMGGGPGPSAGGPKKMGGGPGPSAGGPKKMMGGPGPSAGGPKKMGGPGPVAGGPKKMVAASPPRSQVRALYNYVGQEEDELTIQAGDVIGLVNGDNPDWWEGELNGKIGVFPANYVERI
jgi:myosin-1